MNKYLEKIAGFSPEAASLVKALAPRFAKQGAGYSSSARALVKNVAGKDKGAFNGVFSAKEHEGLHSVVDQLAKKHNMPHEHVLEALHTAAGLGRRAAKKEMI